MSSPRRQGTPLTLQGQLREIVLEFLFFLVFRIFFLVFLLLSLRGFRSEYQPLPRLKWEQVGFYLLATVKSSNIDSLSYLLGALQYQFQSKIIKLAAKVIAQKVHDSWWHKELNELVTHLICSMDNTFDNLRPSEFTFYSQKTQDPIWFSTRVHPFTTSVLSNNALILTVLKSKTSLTT